MLVFFFACDSRSEHAFPDRPKLFCIHAVIRHFIRFSMKRSVCRLLLCTLLVLSAAAVCRAQANQQPEGTLPPVVVQPPTEGESQDEPTLPPVDVTPPSGSTAAGGAGQPGDAFANFPGLSDLRLGEAGSFGENTGILRGSQSLFDTPSAASIRGREEIQERQAPDMFQALQNHHGEISTNFRTIFAPIMTKSPFSRYVFGNFEESRKYHDQMIPLIYFIITIYIERHTRRAMNYSGFRMQNVR